MLFIELISPIYIECKFELHVWWRDLEKCVRTIKGSEAAVKGLYEAGGSGEETVWTERECVYFMCVCVEGWLAVPREIDWPHTHILMAVMVR